MIERFIPAYVTEIGKLSEIALSGFIMGFGIGMSSKADHVVNTYPAKWAELYEENDYMFLDPVVQWLMTTSGSTRWSSIKIPDTHGIRPIAATYGLRYGAVISKKLLRRRCFLAFARNDREFTEQEIAVWEAKFSSWCPLVVEERPVLNEREISVLRGLRDGLGHAEIANSLSISIPTVRQRQNSAIHKLGAKNSHNALSLAVSYQLV